MGSRRKMEPLKKSPNTFRVVTSAETILIMTHDISCITYSKLESIHGVYRFFSTQPITKKAKMNRYTVLESQNRLSTSRNRRTLISQTWS